MERNCGKITARVGEGRHGDYRRRVRWRKEDVEEGNAGRERERVSRRRVGDPLKPVVGSGVGRTS